MGKHTMSSNHPEYDSFNAEGEETYRRWRDEKLKDYPQSPSDLLVDVADPLHPTKSEQQAIQRLVLKTNMALFASRVPAIEVADAKEQAKTLGAAFGLRQLDANLCADEDAITPLAVDESGKRPRYIPYTDRPINWHTDGYYNELQYQIRGMVLQCVRPAAEGGESALMDPEIAYILLREENPDMVRAFFQPLAMTIPANEEQDGVIRPARTGPVFSVHTDDGSLHMRYTARTRSIEWFDDTDTKAAVDFLAALLKSPSPLIFRHRLEAGQGVLCNNVLHNRSGFKDSDEQSRLFLRARFYDRISGT